MIVAGFMIVWTAGCDETGTPNQILNPFHYAAFRHPTASLAAGTLVKMNERVEVDNATTCFDTPRKYESLANISGFAEIGVLDWYSAEAYLETPANVNLGSLGIKRIQVEFLDLTVESVDGKQVGLRVEQAAKVDAEQDIAKCKESLAIMSERGFPGYILLSVVKSARRRYRFLDERGKKMLIESDVLRAIGAPSPQKIDAHTVEVRSPLYVGFGPALTAEVLSSEGAGTTKIVPNEQFVRGESIPDWLVLQPGYLSIKVLPGEAADKTRFRIP